MAYNDSGELPVSQSTYSLGGYTFELKVQTVHEPGEPDVVSVFAICRGPDGTRETVPMDFPEGTTVESWAVEANETEASVYVLIKDESGINAVKVTCDISVGTYYRGDVITGKSGPDYFGNVWDVTLCKSSPGVTWLTKYNNAVYAANESGNNKVDGIYYLTSYPNEYGYRDVPKWAGGWTTTARAGNGVFSRISNFNSFYENIPESTVDPHGKRPHQQIKGGEYLVARFAIDIREADTDSWDEPGDDGPPGTTLNVTVTGATAGSCTGTPSDNLTVKGYGDGGDGGYGGGGGAGASTVIIYEFATDIAESVQQEAISRGPGTGGPGGKGGNGGDGCILIFY